METTTETTKRGRKTKRYNIHSNNQVYFDGYMESFTNSLSANQYRGTVAPFLVGLTQRSLKRVTVADIETFLAEGGNSEAKVKAQHVHLSAFLKWAVRNDVNNIKAEIARDVLVWLV